MQKAPFADIILGSIAGILLQVLLALPFLLQHPLQYLCKAFEFSRVFLLQWSVNWSSLPDWIFSSKPFATCLLAGHVSLLALFAQFRWCKAEAGLHQLLVHRCTCKLRSASARHKVANVCNETQRSLLILFSGNLIGIVFARTLHFQFYSWYFHSLPFLVWQAGLSIPLCLLILLCIEVSWNMFPPSAGPSIVLLVCHCAILSGLWKRRDWAVQISSARRMQS